MWNPNVQSPLIYTPRSLTWSLASIGSPLSFSCLTVGNLSSPYRRHSNLLELHFILFFDAHSYMLSKSFWKFCRSSMVLTLKPCWESFGFPVFLQVLDDLFSYKFLEDLDNMWDEWLLVYSFWLLLYYLLCVLEPHFWIFNIELGSISITVIGKLKL